MNTNQMLQHMIGDSPWVDPENTVDTIKAGDGEKEIHTVAVCWYPSLETLRAAIELGCDLLVTHEPTWWDHHDRPGGWRERGPGLEKTKLLQDSGMVVARLHDTWDNWPVHGIRDSLAKGLGFTRFVGEDETRWHATYEVEPQSLRDFARTVAQKVAPLGEDAVQVVGDPEMIVQHPSIGVGCGGPGEDMIDIGSDVLIMCFDGASYWSQRERFAEQVSVSSPSSTERRRCGEWSHWPATSRTPGPISTCTTLTDTGRPGTSRPTGRGGELRRVRDPVTDGPAGLDGGCTSHLDLAIHRSRVRFQSGVLLRRPQATRALNRPARQLTAQPHPE